MTVCVRDLDSFSGAVAATATGAAPLPVEDALPRWECAGGITDRAGFCNISGIGGRYGLCCAVGIRRIGCGFTARAAGALPLPGVAERGAPWPISVIGVIETGARPVGIETGPQVLPLHPGIGNCPAAAPYELSIPITSQIARLMPIFLLPDLWIIEWPDCSKIRQPREGQVRILLRLVPDAKSLQLALTLPDEIHIVLLRETTARQRRSQGKQRHRSGCPLFGCHVKPNVVSLTEESG